MPHSHDSPAVGDILRQPGAALLAACFAMSAAHGALYVFYSIHLADHGYSKAEVGALWSLGVLAEIAVFMLMAAGPGAIRRAFCAGQLRLPPSALPLLIGWAVESLAVMVMAQLMHGLTFGAYHASVSAIDQGFWPRAGRGQALYSSLVRRRWPARR